VTKTKGLPAAIRIYIFIAYILFIFGLTFFGRQLIAPIRSWGYLSGVVIILILSTLAFFTRQVLRAGRDITIWHSLLLSGPFLTAGTMFITLKFPEEKFHFVEYGLLGYLCGWVQEGRRYFGKKEAMALLLLVGVLDELIQGVLPYRIFDIHDIFWNSVSSWCGILVFFVAAKKTVKK